MYFQFQPDSIDLDIKDSVFVTIKLLDKNGNLSNNPFFVYGGERGTVSAKPRISDSTGVAKVMLKVFKPLKPFETELLKVLKGFKRF